MGMDWLKGLVGPVAQFSPGGQPVQGHPGSPAFPPAYGAPTGAPAAGPPMGGAPPPGAWGPPQGAWDPNAAAGGGAPTYGAPAAYGPPATTYGAPATPPAAWSPTAPAAPAAPQAAWSPTAPAAPAGSAEARVLQLENRCEAIGRDLESVALFAQTLLAVLEEKKLMSQQDFHEMRRKLDLLDGRLDDRIAKST